MILDQYVVTELQQKGSLHGYQTLVCRNRHNVCCAQLSWQNNIRLIIIKTGWVYKNLTGLLIKFVKTKYLKGKDIEMTIILATDNDWAIGKNGRLLAHIPEDMKFFRKTTMNSIVVMGRKTWESIGAKPLPNRKNCIISRTIRQLDNARVFNSIEDFLEFAKKTDEKIFVIGGGEIYRQLLPYCNEAYITRIYESFGGNVFFTDIEHDKNWELKEVSPMLSSECHNIRFFRYERNNKSV